MRQMKKIPVGVIGATGLVGQQYLKRLDNHPWFEVVFLGATLKSQGKTFREAIAGRQHATLPDKILNIPVSSLEEIKRAKNECHLIFSALSAEGAKDYEEHYAEEGLPVISNASYHRTFDDIPVLIPEVNPEHSAIIPFQQKNRGWKTGFIAVKPNCSLPSYMIPLAPLHQRFKIKKIILTTMQALSGAGYPGIPSLDIIDNIIPYIPLEEEKSEQEPLKILGSVQDSRILPNHLISISAHCNRVPVMNGHMACVSVKFEHPPKSEEILDCWKNFQGIPQKLNLPNAPLFPIVYTENHDRPQPRLDRDLENGMAVTVGRLRKCPVFDFRFTALSHNTIRGAAGGGILNAELLYQQGYFE